MAYIGRTPTGSILTSADIADGSISTAKLEDNAVTTAKITDNAVTAAKYVEYPAYRNLIINGDMSIAQRGTSASGLTNGSSQYLIDRFKWYEGGAPTYQFTMSQDTDVPTGQGFAKSLKLQCTTAQTSLGAGDQNILWQRMEGQNLQHLKFGTANAESLSLSFWVKSSKTGTYIVELYQPDGSRGISKSYTISSANTWEKKIITCDGDTSGTINNDNGAGLDVYFFLSAGSNFQSGTLATSWQSYNLANEAVGQLNLADSTSNNWYITGVQLEVGTSASDFEFLPYDVNLQRCQRYYQETLAYIGHGHSVSTTTVGQLIFGTYMRSTPSLSQTGVITITDGYSGDYTQSSTGGLTIYKATEKTFGYFIVIGNFSGLSTGHTYFSRHNTVNRLTLDAEL